MHVVTRNLHICLLYVAHILFLLYIIFRYVGDKVDRYRFRCGYVHYLYNMYLCIFTRNKKLQKNILFKQWVFLRDRIIYDNLNKSHGACGALYVACFILSISLTTFFLETCTITTAPYTMVIFFISPWYTLTYFGLDFIKTNYISLILNLNSLVKFLTFPRWSDFHSRPCCTTQNLISHTSSDALFFRFLQCEANPSWICERLWILTHEQQLNFRICKTVFSKKMYFYKSICNCFVDKVPLNLVETFSSTIIKIM